MPCLDSHDPIDLVVIMLGTNELKAGYGLTTEEIAEMMRNMVAAVRARPSQYLDKSPRVLIVSPPYINEETEYCKAGGKYIGSGEKSRQLAISYKKIAEELETGYLDAGAVTETGPDGVHITESSHDTLGRSIAEATRTIIG